MIIYSNDMTLYKPLILWKTKPLPVWPYICVYKFKQKILSSLNIGQWQYVVENTRVTNYFTNFFTNC